MKLWLLLLAVTLYAAPVSSDGGILYYRKDLVPTPPKTWDEMMSMCSIANSKNIGCYSGQFKKYEGLTVNALEWLETSGGGTIIDPAGRITVNNPNAAKILTRAASWINGADPIAPPGVLHFTEEETHQWFKDGKAVFMRNWPYAKKLLEADDSAVKKKFGVTDLPRGAFG